MAQCELCGIYDEAEGLCHKYQTKSHPGDCYYFCEIQWEDGERMSPQYHLILQDMELKSKRMQGPV